MSDTEATFYYVRNAFAHGSFEAVPNGANIDAGELTGFDVVYAPEAETITVK